MADAFPVRDELINLAEHKIEGTAAEILENFSAHHPKGSPFENSGVIIDRVFTTAKLLPAYDGPTAKLGDFILPEKEIPEEFFIPEDKLPAWQKLKGAKREERKTSTGHTYFFSEGAMAFPDPLDKPSHTIIVLSLLVKVVQGLRGSSM